VKTIYLVRHAKSDWSVAVDDFDRPLNNRGKRDAPKMAVWMLERKARIDVFVSSPARRALKTARIFANAYKRDDDDIIVLQKLYLPAAPVFYDVIHDLDNRHECAAIFSHNSGITEFANMLGVASVDNIPTCGIFAVRADTDNWSEFSEAKKELLFFDYPKKYE